MKAIIKKIICFILGKFKGWVISVSKDVSASYGATFIRALPPFLKRFAALSLTAKVRLIVSVYFMREEFSEFLITSLFATYVVFSTFGQVPHKEISDLLVLVLAILVSIWFNRRSRKFQFHDSDLKKKK